MRAKFNRYFFAPGATSKLGWYARLLPILLAPILVYIGFFVAGVSFAIATIPFFCAILTRSKIKHMALTGSYFGAIAAISSWGLIQMGAEPLWVIAAAAAATVVISLLFAYLGVGLGCVALMFLPFFPGNPLLATGSILPGTGLFGLMFMVLALMLIELMDGLKLRVAALSILLAVVYLPPLALAQFRAFNQTPATAGLVPDGTSTPARIPGPIPPPPPVFPLESLDIRAVQAASEWGYFAALAETMQPGSLYITGENIIGSDHTAAIAFWCRQVRARDLHILMGVRNAADGVTDGQGQLWYFTRKTCRQPDPKPTVEYAASIGIPGLTGGITPMPPPTPTTLPNTTLPNTGFLACFEGFSLYRWIQVGFRRNRQVITFSNDHWTEPLKVGLLRRKIARQMEHLFGIKTAHAEASKTMLVMKLSKERTER